tara:strand:- start:1193 stop:1597 length:405 start_codon:yes stop_codon:yes gene_type:complete
MYSLYNIFDQATQVYGAIVNKTKKVEYVLYGGAKIQKFEDKIEILNLGRGGDYFKECNKDEYDYFRLHGFSAGADMLLLDNYLFKLKMIEDRIKTEVNTRKNDKHIQNLKNKREKILQKYTQRKIKLKTKLNQN